MIKCCKALVGLVIAALFCILQSCQHTDKVEAAYAQGLIKLKEIEGSDYAEHIKIERLDSLFNQTLRKPSKQRSEELLLDITKTSYNIGLLDNFHDYSKHLLTIALNNKDSLAAAQAYWYIGDYYEDVNKLDSAYYNYNLSEVFLHGQKRLHAIAKIKYFKSIILFEEGMLDQAETEAFHAIQNLPENDFLLRLEAYNTLGNILVANGRIEEGIAHFEQAIATLAKKYPSASPEELIYFNKILASFYNNLGNTLNLLEEHQRAKVAIEKGVDAILTTGKKGSMYAMLLNNLGSAHLSLGDTLVARHFFFESLAIRDSLNLPQGKVTSYDHLARYYLLKQDTTAAIAHWEKSLEYANEVGSSQFIKQALRNLSLHSKQDSRKYMGLAFKVSDSLHQLSRIKIDYYSAIEFNTEQILEKNKNLSKQNTYLLISLVFILLVMLLIALLYHLRSKSLKFKKDKKQQDEKELIYKLFLKQDKLVQEVLENDRKRISRELHDGIANTIFTVRLAFENGNSLSKEELLNALQNMEDQIRKISHDLQSQELLSGCFNELLQELINFHQGTETEVELLIPRMFDWSRFDNEEKIQLYRIIQESLQNVLKHAKAKKCYVTIYETQNDFKIVISDNGVGFEKSKSPKGIGLKNIRSRVEDVGAKLVIYTSDRGTTLEITKPKEKEV